MDGASRARQVEDAIDFEKNRFRDIVTEQFEVGVIPQMLHVYPTTRKEIVEANDLVPVREQTLAQMTSQESGSAGDQATHRNSDFILA